MVSKKFVLTVVEPEKIKPLYREPERSPETCKVCQIQLIVVADYSQFICPDCGNVVNINRGGGDHPFSAA